MGIRRISWNLCKHIHACTAHCFASSSVSYTHLDTDDPADSVDGNQGEYGEDGNYVGIGDTSWEAALRLAYGDHFFNTRTYMIENGLSDYGLDTTTDDLRISRKVIYLNN